MKSIDDLPLVLKLALAPALCLTLLALSAAGALWGFGQQRAALESVHGSRLPSYAFVAGLESGLKDMNGLVNRSLGYEAMGFNAEEVGSIDAELARVSSEIRSALVRRSAMTGLPEAERADLASLSASFSKYDKAVKDTLDMKSAGAVMAVSFLSTAQAEYGKLLKITSRQLEARLAEANVDVKQAGAMAAAAQNAIGIFAAVAMALGVLLTLGFARRLRRRLRSASEAMRSLAAGDLTWQAIDKSGDEIGELLNDIATVRDRLTTSIGAVRQASESVRLAAGEIAGGNADLSRRTEQVATSLQQTAASMEQMSRAVQDNAATARHADELATATREVAGHGGEVMSRVVRTMEEISSSSKKIADIIGVIDGIAFQTNILALNAAVEAARAGEQGRGFAVVANEVRGLAQRSAEAAREIKQLIVASVERVEAGSLLVGDAGSRMQDIVSQVQRVSTLIGAISEASREQTNGIELVSMTVTAVDQSTQQNAALVEESAAAAESLQEQAVRLVEAVRVFRLQPPCLSSSAPH